MDFSSLVFFLATACLLVAAMPQQGQSRADTVEVSESKPAEAAVAATNGVPIGGPGLGYRLGLGLGAVNGLVRSVLQRRMEMATGEVLQASASGGGYGAAAAPAAASGGGGGGLGDLIGGLGGLVGGLFSNLLKSFAGIGIRLGLNVNKELYNAKTGDSYGSSGGYGGGSSGGGYGGGSSGGGYGGGSSGGGYGGGSSGGGYGGGDGGYGGGQAGGY